MGPRTTALKKFFRGLFIFSLVLAALAIQVSFFMLVWEQKYQPKYPVVQMFEQDGCTAYKFADNGADQYFVRCKCGAEIKWSNGKVGVVACTQVTDPKLDVREQPKLVMPAPPEDEKPTDKKK